MLTLKYHVYFLPTRMLFSNKRNFNFSFLDQKFVFGYGYYNFCLKLDKYYCIGWKMSSLSLSWSSHTDFKFKSNSFKISFEQNENPNNHLKFGNVKNIIED